MTSDTPLEVYDRTDFLVIGFGLITLTASSWMAEGWFLATIALPALIFWWNRRA